MNTCNDNVNYILVVSQYYHSRHYFLIDAIDISDKEYFENARSFISNVEKYKRYVDVLKSITYGDMDDNYFKGKAKRYNVNDYGDIYFIPCWSFEQVLNNVIEYQNASRKESVGYIKNKVLSEISEHHDQKRIKEILERYFVVL